MTLEVLGVRQLSTAYRTICDCMVLCQPGFVPAVSIFVLATHWSTTLMAKETGLNPMAISRIWCAFGLKPHLVDTFKLSTDPHFIENVHDIVGLHMSPPGKALVLCVDE